MDQEKQAMAAYYAQRAATYDEIYTRPARQAEQEALFAQVAQLAQGQKVLELACGTGYWSKILAEHASHVVAVDCNTEMLDIAAARGIPAEKIRFVKGDVYQLPAELASEKFTLCFAAFWWSHVKRAEQEKFVQQVRAIVGSNCQLVLIDNSYVEGDSTPIARTDLDGNTHQFRKQQDGSTIEIVKNFPSDSNLRKRFSNLARDLRVHRGKYFWLLTGRLK